MPKFSSSVQSDAGVLVAPRRPSFASEPEEKIIIKPSTELISDEYVHNIENANVHLFTTSEDFDKFNTNEFKKSLECHGYKIPTTNIHNLTTEDFMSIIDEIRNNSGKAEALLMYFTGSYASDGCLKVFGKTKGIYSINLQEIWKKFTTYNCPQLKNKPKIFMFQLSKPLSSVATDGKQVDTKYDTPGEADMLMVFNRTRSEDRENAVVFTEQLSRNIMEFAKQEDIVSLVTNVLPAEGEKCPLMISTLTRKFYVTPSSLRGNNLTVIEHSHDITNKVKEVRKKFEEVTISGKKKKIGLFGSFRQTFSWNVNEDKPRKDVTNSKTVSKQVKEIKGGKSVLKNQKKTPLASSSTVKDEKLVVPTVRSRTTTMCSSASSLTAIDKIGKKGDTKPPWK